MHGCFELGGYWLDRIPGRPGWYAFWYDAGRRKTRRRSLGREDCDLEAAKLIFSEWVLRTNQPRDVEPEELRLAVALASYIDRVTGEETPGSESAEYHSRYIAAFFKGDLVSELTPARQKGFIKDLGGKGLSPGYIGRIMSTLSAALGDAEEDGVLRRRPKILMSLEAIEPLVGRAAPESMRRLSLAELGSFLDEIKAEHIWRYCLLGLNTLGRPDAITDLARPQVDLDGGIIHLNPRGRVQTKKWRPIVPITATLLPWLRIWIGDKVDRRGNLLPPLLVHYKHGPVENPKKAFREAAIRAGLMSKGTNDDVTQNVTPYTLRRTMAREMRKRKVPLEQIAGFLGHNMPGFRTTEIYADVVPEVLADARQGIDDILCELQAHTTRKLLPAPTMHPQGKKQGASHVG